MHVKFKFLYCTQITDPFKKYISINMSLSFGKWHVTSSGLHDISCPYPCSCFLVTFYFLQGSGHVHGMGPLQAHSMGWPRVQGIPTTPIVKRVVRLDVPVDKYPNVS